MKINDTPQIATIGQPIYQVKKQKSEPTQNGQRQAPVTENSSQATHQPIVHSTPIHSVLKQPAVASKAKHILVLLPIGIPGMGKTHFINEQLKDILGGEESNIQIASVSNDQHRKLMMD